MNGLGSRKEHLIRITGRVESLQEIQDAVVAPRSPAPILVRHVADVRFGSPVKRGDGSVDAKPAVILSIQKQPEADTVRLTAQIDLALEEVRGSLPEDVEINSKLFRQQEFIDVAIYNVEEALVVGAVLVIFVLFLFLMNLRTSIINLTAIPLSFVATAFVFQVFGMTINTMTLGGLAVAIGELVDDSIVDVENIFRRLKENRGKIAQIPGGLLAFLRCIDDDVQDVVSIIDQGGRPSQVEFEWVGWDEPLEGGRITRGANQTSIDALVVANIPTGHRAYLLEWKYCEEYLHPKNKGLGRSGDTRRSCYQHLFRQPESSFNQKISLDNFFSIPSTR